MAASPNPIIWDFYHEVKDAGVDSEPVGVVHYYDGDAQTFYLKNGELVTMTAEVENSNWKGIDKRYSYELPILKFADGTEKAKYDHPSNGTLYMILDDGKDMYFLRYIYMIDASPILDSWSLGLQADNPIINMNATIMNADPGLYDTDTSLFEPGSRYFIKSVFNDTDILRLGMGFIDEVSYSHADETISISGRNTSGFMLKDQTFNDRTEFKGSAGYVCREMLKYAGIKKFVVQDLTRSGKYEIKDTETILDGIQGVLELCYNENGMGTKDSIARIIELADGTICVGQSSWLEEKGYFQNAYYTFDRGSDVFSRKVKKDVDACYTAVRATGKKKEDTVVTPDPDDPGGDQKEQDEYYHSLKPGEEASKVWNWWRNDAVKAFEKLKTMNDNPFTSDIPYWPWCYWAQYQAGMPEAYYKDFIKYCQDITGMQPQYFDSFYDFPEKGRGDILYVVKKIPGDPTTGDPGDPTKSLKYRWTGLVYELDPNAKAIGREFTTTDWNIWIMRVPFYKEPEAPLPTVDNFYRGDMNNEYLVFKNAHEGEVINDMVWMDWAESLKGSIPDKYRDSLMADIGRTYVPPSSTNYSEAKYNVWVANTIPLSGTDKTDPDASYTDVVKYISQMAVGNKDFEVFGLKPAEVATKLNGMIDKIPLKGAKECVKGLIGRATEMANTEELKDLTFNIQEMLDWANKMDNPEDMLDNYLKDIETSDSITTKNNMLDPVTVEVAHYDFWTYGKNRVKHLSAPDGLTQSQLREWAESQALKYQMAGIQEDFSGPYRPQLQIGDIAEFLQNGGGKTLAVTIGFVTSVTHSFSSKKGYTTDFTVESGGIDYESIDKGDTTVVVGIANSGVNRPTRLYDMNSGLRLMQDKIETRSGCTEAKLNETLNAARQIKRVVGNQTDALRLLEQTVYWMWEQFKKTQTNEEV